jgi:hypothetical protein
VVKQSLSPGRAQFIPRSAVLARLPTRAASLRPSSGTKPGATAIEYGLIARAHLGGDRRRTLEKRPRPRKIALLPKQVGEVVEARCRIRMLGAE